MRIAFVISNATQVAPTWTTVSLIAAALSLGHEVRVIEARDFEISLTGALLARAHAPTTDELPATNLASALAGRRLPRRYVNLASCDLLLLRCNPLPAHVYAVLLMAARAGVRVVNDPVGVALTRSKAWLASLHDVPTPRTVVTTSRASAQHFAEDVGGPVVVKPALSSGGRGVHLVPWRSPDLLDEAMSSAFRAADGPLVFQAYVPEADLGEKRLVWSDGRVLGAYLRLRAPGEFRHNLRRGGLPETCALTEMDLHAAAAISPHLLQNGIRIAGLDVIGGLLLEVNTLNPGGVFYAESLAPPTGEPASSSLAERILDNLTKPLSLPYAEEGHA